MSRTHLSFFFLFFLSYIFHFYSSINRLFYILILYSKFTYYSELQNLRRKGDYSVIDYWTYTVQKVKILRFKIIVSIYGTCLKRDNISTLSFFFILELFRIVICLSEINSSTLKCSRVSFNLTQAMSPALSVRQNKAPSRP